MTPTGRHPGLFLVLAGLSGCLAIAAGLANNLPAQGGPFPTVPPPNATFQPPIQAGPTARPGFAPVGFQRDLSLAARFREGAGYLLAGGAAIALGAAALWADRVRQRSASVLPAAGPGKFGAGPRRFSFRPRLRRLTWIIPSGAGLVLLGLAATKCVPPKVCYTNVGGVEIVVPCEQVEGSVKEQVTATATPGIDCPDPGRGGTSAYEAAKAGGRHAPYLQQARGWPDASLARAFRSFEATVADHVDKIQDPSAQNLRTPWDQMDHREQEGLLKQWCTDLVRNREQADVILGVMKERGLSP